jgi:hypothetical protein
MQFGRKHLVSERIVFKKFRAKKYQIPTFVYGFIVLLGHVTVRPW